MCWSLEVSVATAVIVYSTAAYLWWRGGDLDKTGGTERDRWNAIFLTCFGSMQTVDAGIWLLFRLGETPGYPCSALAQAITLTGLGIIILEPISCLLGSMYARKEFVWSQTEFFYYVIANLGSQFMWGYLTPLVYSDDLCPSGAGGTCPHISEHGHLIYAFAVDRSGGPKCWREFGLVGQPTSEIPLFMRVAFLAGMVYPYLTYAQPLGSGIVQSLILTATWLVGYYSDSHASVWCLANVAQVVTMLADARWFPRSPKPMSTPVPHKVTPSGALARDLYTKAKAESSSFDYIFVGSGIGSLACAALLSRAGYRCLVLEQHSTVGGATHEFTNHGNSFDSGIHYVGGSQIIKTMLSYITDAPGVFLAKMNGDTDGCYDEFDLGKNTTIESDESDESDDVSSHFWVRYRAGRSNMICELKEKFPHEADGIDKYFRRVDSAQSSLTALVLLKALPDALLRIGFVRRWLVARMQRDANVTATEVVSQCVSDKRLQALLAAGQLIDWGGLPNETAWSVVGGMASYYSEGGFYPAGGSRKIAQHIIPIIERAGGRVLCNVRVERILNDDKDDDDDDDNKDGAAIGVQLEKGDKIFAKQGIVSDAGIATTVEMLSDKALAQINAKSSLEKTISRDLPAEIGFSNGHMTAFVSLDGTPEELGLRAANIHSWTGLAAFGNDADELQSSFYKEPLKQARNALMTITAPCAKDPDYIQGKSNVLLLTEGRGEWFKDMDVDAIHRFYAGIDEQRGASGYPSDADPSEAAVETYMGFKKAFEQVFLERLYQYYPRCKGKVLHIEVGTPLTTAHFLNAKNGGSYGLAWTPERFTEPYILDSTKVATHVPKLFLTGESALFGGFAGAMGGGYVCALKILGALGMAKIILTTPSIDAERLRREARKKNHDADTPVNLALNLVSIILVMILGQRIGRGLLSRHC